MKKILSIGFLFICSIFFGIVYSQAIKVNSAGKVGINGEPASNNYKLNVNGSTQTSSLSTGGISFTGQDFYINNGTNKFKIYGFYNNTYVGMGINPSTAWTLIINGDALANGGIWQDSDAKLKKDISSLDGQLMLDKINLIDAKKYKFKTREELLPMYISGELKQKRDTFYVKEKLNGKDTIVEKTRIFTPNLPEGDKYGVIADEIVDVFPEFVKLDSSSGPYAVDYIGFIPVLIASIKEQQNQIELLEDKIEKLKKEKEATLKRALITTDISTDASISGNELMQNAPNPFSESTVISYNLSNNVSNASIYIYDMNGKQLKKVDLELGNGSITINGYEFDAGIYMYTLIADGQVVGTKSMILTD